MELIFVLVAIALATGISSHLFLVSPILKSLKLYSPNSFGATNSKLVAIVTAFFSSCFFPVMILILLSDGLSKSFMDAYQRGLEEEEKS